MWDVQKLDTVVPQNWAISANTPSGLKRVHAQFLYIQWHNHDTYCRHTLLGIHLDYSHYRIQCKCFVNNCLLYCLSTQSP